MTSIPYRGADAIKLFTFTDPLRPRRPLPLNFCSPPAKPVDVGEDCWRASVCKATCPLASSGEAMRGQALQHEEAPQCIGSQTIGPGNHHTDGSEANDARTIKLNQSDEAAQFQRTKKTPAGEKTHRCPSAKNVWPRQRASSKPIRRFAFSFSRRGRDGSGSNRMTLSTNPDASASWRIYAAVSEIGYPAFETL